MADTRVETLQALRTKHQDMHNYLNGMGNSRELWQAKARLKEAIMWAFDHLDAHQPKLEEP